jgi:hypothetical protein
MSMVSPSQDKSRLNRSHDVDDTFPKKEASHWKLLCDTMRRWLEGGDATAEDWSHWTDCKGNALRPDRFGELESRSSLPPPMKGHI